MHIGIQPLKAPRCFVFHSRIRFNRPKQSMSFAAIGDEQLHEVRIGFRVDILPE